MPIMVGTTPRRTNAGRKQRARGTVARTAAECSCAWAAWSAAFHRSRAAFVTVSAAGAPVRLARNAAAATGAVGEGVVGAGRGGGGGGLRPGSGGLKAVAVAAAASAGRRPAARPAANRSTTGGAAATSCRRERFSLSEIRRKPKITTPIVLS